MAAGSNWWRALGEIVGSVLVLAASQSVRLLDLDCCKVECEIAAKWSVKSLQSGV